MRQKFKDLNNYKIKMYLKKVKTPIDKEKNSPQNGVFNLFIFNLILKKHQSKLLCVYYVLYCKSIRRYVFNCLKLK